MKKYYCSVWFDDDSKFPYEFDYIYAKDEDEALEIFKEWFLGIYGHYDNCLNGRYEVEECINHLN